MKDSIWVTNKIPNNVSDEHCQGLTFHPFDSNIPSGDDVISILGKLGIEHVTEFQSFHEWHVARKVSMLLKGVAVQVLIQLRLDKER